MKIAQVAPLYESVPPKFYGGTERVVSYLTEELVRQGHDVTLFASGDSITSATLVPVCEQATRLNPDCKDPMTYHIMEVGMVANRASEFDIIHWHNDYLHFPVSQKSEYAHITTLHGRLDLPELQYVYHTFRDIPVVSISNHQRRPLSFANFVQTVYHGVPADLYPMGNGDGGYLAFIGRISPEKRPDRAIEIAKRAGIPLKIAAKVDKVDMEYYEQTIKPMMDHPLIEFIGEIGDEQKAQFLGNAMALLFPIDWPEPFGMVMIEAMANGTPVVAFDCGSVPEVIDRGKTGYVVRSVQGAVDAVTSLHKFSRKQCRAVFEERFSAERMAKDYVAVYERMAASKRKVFALKAAPIEHVLIPSVQPIQPVAAAIAQAK